MRLKRKRKKKQKKTTKMAIGKLFAFHTNAKTAFKYLNPVM